MVFADNEWNHDIRIMETRALTEDLTVYGLLSIEGGTFNLNGKTLTVKGNLNLGAATLTIGGGNLYVDNNFNWGTASGTSTGRLQMTNVNDYILVNGDFLAAGYYSQSGYLTAGTLEVKGNFTQRAGNAQNFLATGTHKVILSGVQLQTVNFGSAQSQFNILEITKNLNKGYNFSRTPLWNEFIENQTIVPPPSAPSNLRFVRSTASTLPCSGKASGSSVRRIF